MLKRNKLRDLLDKNYIARHPEKLPTHLALYAGHEVWFWFIAVMVAWFVCYLAVSFLG